MLNVFCCCLCRSIVPWIKKYGTNPISGEVSFSCFGQWTLGDGLSESNFGAATLILRAMKILSLSSTHGYYNTVPGEQNWYAKASGMISQ